MKLRTERGVAPEDLAYELGLEISRVSRIERGLINTSIYNLYRFLKF
ncbi:MAG: helix-turn-helix transcriptional regulator [Bacteroidia bacterium]|nr:helix-turn-helix transcriptional regulator [Bacteroidota bacterium]